MKPFKSWPKWLQILSICSLVALVLGAMLTVDYLSGRDPATGKTALAQRFEQAPQAWLSRPKDVSAFELALARGEVQEVGVDGTRVLVTTRQGERYSTSLLSASNGLGARLESMSREHGFGLTPIHIDERAMGSRLADSASNVFMRLFTLASLAVTGLLVFYVIRQGGGMGSGKLQLAERPDTAFDDVVGAAEAKAALQQVTAFMKSPDKYLALGAKPPRGVLLEGPPGTGKTLLARALAGECGANFIAVDGSHFSSMFYGAGITKVKELFATARKHAPCIVFIDEFDGIGQRSNGSGRSPNGGASEENRIINKLLVEMDGFSPTDNVVVIGATNHVRNVDEALKRPGRFDLVARVTLPTLDERRGLYELCLGRIKAAPDVDTAALARSSSALSQADIANVVNRAAVLAAEQEAPEVGLAHLLRALESHQLGGEVSGIKGLMTQQDRHRIAVHESGHAIVAHALRAGLVERVTIEPRGQALGVTFVTRSNELPLYGEHELHARLGMLLAGREAELLVFGNTTSGASDDLKRASELAIDMVSSMGFSEAFGLLSMQGVPDKLVGPHIQERVLAEARAMLERAQTACRTALQAQQDALQALTDALLRDETVSGPALESLLNPA
ncbi:MAG: ATP-dependent metallopeptidase FtsH/Yme1/Tma family protein [Acidobacteriota bacterium]